MLLKPRFLIFALLIISSSLTAEVKWSESVCDHKSDVFQGATRDFYNRGASLKWQNPLGDWYDTNLKPQGTKPFSKFGVNGEKTLEADITNLIRIWKAKLLPNHGVLVKYHGGPQVSIHSNESTNHKLRPILILKTLKKTIEIDISMATALLPSTYKCIGQDLTIKLNGTALFYFEIPPTIKNIKTASIRFSTLKTIKKKPQLSVYSIRLNHVDDFVHIKRQRQSNYSHPFYQTNFENNNWLDDWELNWGNYGLVDNDDANKFEPINGKALKVTINKGAHNGISAKLLLENYSQFAQLDKKSVYLKYAIRFADNWAPKTNGKLPGIAGTYEKNKRRGGWGGRRSTGYNGWSARAFFDETILQPNPLAEKIVVGSYLYHANQIKNYGDKIIWDQNPRYILTKNKWYIIEQFVQINDLGNNNGIVKSWVDGQLVYSNYNLLFTNTSKVSIESIWLNIYHGGKQKAPQDITVYIDDLAVSTSYIGTN